MQFRVKFLSQYAFSRNPTLVYRADIPTMHTHVSSKHVAHTLINLIKQGYLPHSKYLLESASKLLTVEEYARLKPFKKKKQKYHNVTIKKTRCLR